ncbi:MAG: sulfotransferase [Actinomycetota bacterium]|nr:sulfotransferase [Actinomycetota bacterium]
MASAPGDLLSVPALVEEAAARAGGSPGHPPFTDNLELLVSSSLRTGRLNDTGLKVLRKAALRHLRNLFYLQAYVDGHPDTPHRHLEGPVVVTGLPRTGTTLLHNLLSLDPANRFLRLWEALHPVPPGPGGPSVEALQAQAEGWLDAFYRMVPEFRAIHPATPSGPEECDALLQNTFASQHFDDMFDAEEYSAWLATAPLAGEYGHYALQLRALAAASPPGTRWALKSPSHLGHLDALLDALPGCRVLVCHRDPRQAVGSYASLIFAVRRPYSEETSPAVVGRQALQRASTAMRRALEVRDRAGGAPFVDVSYRELARDPVATVHAVYRQLGRSLDAAIEERMRRWVGENPQHKHGAHRYDLASFGLTEAEVDGAFAPYVERFASALAG